MTETATKLEQAIEQAASQYYRLVLLAGLPGSGKTFALQSVAQKLDRPLVNVNLELSKKMLELTRTQRSAAAPFAPTKTCCK
jgi:chromosomal replication initiation ATPase DnaA